jgi:hypothetical protein
MYSYLGTTTLVNLMLLIPSGAGRQVGVRLQRIFVFLVRPFVPKPSLWPSEVFTEIWLHYPTRHLVGCVTYASPGRMHRPQQHRERLDPNGT